VIECRQCGIGEAETRLQLRDDQKVVEAIDRQDLL
jgi:hypothetical protein